MREQHTFILPTTWPQWALLVVAYPWLAMVTGWAMPCAASAYFVGWLVAQTFIPAKLAVFALSAPFAVLLVSLTAAVCLACHLEARRLECERRTAAGD